MAPKKPARPKIDLFAALGDVEAGDELKLHFTSSSIRAVSDLIDMINEELITCAGVITLLAIRMDQSWGWEGNRYVEFNPTPAFDRQQFEQAMRRNIDKLEVTKRTRPLVDVSSLNQHSGSIRYRFTTRNEPSEGEIWEGVENMLLLHAEGALTLNAPDSLAAALAARQWDAENPDLGRIGRFTNWLAGKEEGDVDQRDFFLYGVTPFLEILRS